MCVNDRSKEKMRQLAGFEGFAHEQLRRDTQAMVQPVSLATRTTRVNHLNLSLNFEM